MNEMTCYRRIGLGVLFLGAQLMTSYAAASTTVAKVSNILVFSRGNLVYVYPVGGITGKISCDGVGGTYYSFSYSRPMASAYLAALLAAKASGTNVTFSGTGACTDQSVSETLDYFSTG